VSHFEKGKIEEFCSVQKGEIEGVETEVSCDGEFFIRSFLEKWSHYHNSNKRKVYCYGFNIRSSAAESFSFIKLPTETIIASALCSDRPKNL
jgi:hypothetical protein